MTRRTLSVDGLNDIFIATTGNLSISTDLQAVMQACQQAAQAQIGEMIFAVDQGIPNFAVVWTGTPNTQQFASALRAALRAVPDVTGIKALSVDASGSVLTYRVEIQTIYGSGVVNG